MAEWSMAPHSKCGRRVKLSREFESPSLRKTLKLSAQRWAFLMCRPSGACSCKGGASIKAQRPQALSFKGLQGPLRRGGRDVAHAVRQISKGPSGEEEEMWRTQCGKSPRAPPARRKRCDARSAANLQGPLRRGGGEMARASEANLPLSASKAILRHRLFRFELNSYPRCFAAAPRGMPPPLRDSRAKPRVWAKEATIGTLRLNVKFIGRR